MTNVTIQPYLFFAGRCDEAISFYQRVLGAEVKMLMRHKESPVPPLPGMLPAGFEEKVMHVELRIGEAVLMASDGCDDQSRFDGFRLTLTLATEADALRAFAGLAEGGNVQMELTRTFWSPCFGMVTDCFGVGWMVTVAAVPA